MSWKILTKYSTETCLDCAAEAPLHARTYCGPCRPPLVSVSLFRDPSHAVNFADFWALDIFRFFSSVLLKFLPFFFFVYP